MSLLIVIEVLSEDGSPVSEHTRDYGSVNPL